MLRTQNPIYQFFASFGLLSDAELEQIVALFKPKVYDEGKIIANIGEINDKLYYIEEGILREFSYQDQDQDQDQDNTVTHWLMSENNFEYIVESFLDQKPSQTAIEIISKKAKLWAISKTDIEKLYVEIPQLNLIGRLMTEQYLAKYEAFIRMLRHSPEKRLAWYDTYHKDLANRVMLKYVASYLQIHSVTLSKLRSKKIV
jgi:CRP-like cAMP-binding protein